MARTFLRFFGRLWESGEFEADWGWESTRLARRSLADPDHQLELVDANGAVVATGTVELRVSRCGHEEVQGVERARVVGQVALHPDARAVLLRRGDRVLHRAEIGTRAPGLGAVEVSVSADGQVHVRWRAEHDRPVVFNLVFVDGRHRRLPVARNLSAQEFRFDTAALPGGLGCSIAVLATDGLRSSLVRSAPFDLPEKPPRVVMLAPAEGDTLSPDQPFTLLGLAQDLAGQAVPDEHLVWFVDGVGVARGRRCSVAGPLAPGAHRIELACWQDGRAVATQACSVSVAERSPEQARWLEMSRGLAATGALG
jgi:hypothetical protein